MVVRHCCCSYNRRAKLHPSSLTVDEFVLQLQDHYKTSVRFSRRPRSGGLSGHACQSLHVRAACLAGRRFGTAQTDAWLACQRCCAQGKSIQLLRTFGAQMWQQVLGK